MHTKAHTRRLIGYILKVDGQGAYSMKVKFSCQEESENIQTISERYNPLMSLTMKEEMVIKFGHLLEFQAAYDDLNSKFRYNHKKSILLQFDSSSPLFNFSSSI